MHKYKINGLVLNSLKGYQRFSEVYQNAKKFYSKNLAMAIDLSKDNITEASFGVTIGKRLANKAVTRNKVKRLLRESLRLIIKERYNYLFFDNLILIWRKKVARAGEISLKDVYPEVFELLNKAEAFRNENNSSDN